MMSNSGPEKVRTMLFLRIHCLVVMHITVALIMCNYGVGIGTVCKSLNSILTYCTPIKQFIHD